MSRIRCTLMAIVVVAAIAPAGVVAATAPTSGPATVACCRG